MKQDMVNMLAHHKEANMNMVNFQKKLILLPLNKIMIMMVTSLLPQYLLCRVPLKTLTLYKLHQPYKATMRLLNMIKKMNYSR